MFRTFPAILICALSAFGQTSTVDRPPAEQETVLRERVTKFYNLQMEGHFRAAEALVCADSKDAYYGAEKRRWTSLDLDRISYENEFKTARVVLTLGSVMYIAGSTVPQKIQLTSSWRTEDGSWCYFVPPPDKAGTATPFGVTRPQEVKPDSEGKAIHVPNAAEMNAKLREVLGGVKLSKPQLRVKGYADSSDELEIHNDMPGQVRLEVHGAELNTVTWTLSKAKLQAGENATLKVVHKPTDKTIKPDYLLRLVIEPTTQIIPILVLFEAPADAKK
jgi:hypothetical protein